MKRTDCFYYFEYQDMGAHIPCCNNHYGIGKCPCENCNDYISKTDAIKIVREHQRNNKKVGSANSDIEKFKDMLERAGILYVNEKDGNYYADDKEVNAITITVDMFRKEANVHGYDGFTVDFTFDEETGTLQHVYIWE